MQELFQAAETGRLVPFIGAGVSMVPPTNLPSWWSVHRAVLRSLAKRAESISGDTKQLADLIVERQEAYKLPPDYAADIISSIAGSAYFDVLRCIDSTTPNSAHLALAMLAQKRRVRVILTTNFDRAIECAFRKLGVPLEVRLAPNDFAVLLTRPEILDHDDPCQLLKLHGSADHPQSLIDTLSQRKRGLPQPIVQCCRRLLRWGHLLFLGYSGADLETDPNYLCLRGDSAEARGISWLVRSGGEPLSAVKDLVDAYGERGTLYSGTLPDWLRFLFSSEDLPDLPNWFDATTETVNAKEKTSEANVAEHTKEWAAKIGAERSALILSRLLHAAGAPGQALQLTKAIYSRLPIASCDPDVEEGGPLFCVFCRPRFQHDKPPKKQDFSEVVLTCDDLPPMLVTFPSFFSQADPELGHYVCHDLSVGYSARSELLAARDMALRSFVLSAADRQNDNPASSAECLNLLAGIAAATGDFAQAERRYHQAIRLAAGSPHVKASLLNNLGIFQGGRGVLDAARDNCQQAIDILRALGDELNATACLLNLANVLSLSGDSEEAERFRREAMTVYARLGHEIGQARIHMSQGGEAIDRDNCGAALVSYQEALAITLRMGSRRDTVAALHGIARAHDAGKAYDLADDAYHEALEAAIACEDWSEAAHIENNLGRLYRDLGRYDEMRAARSRAGRRYREMGDHRGVAETLYAEGYDYGVCENHRAAADCFRVATRLYDALGLGDKALDSLANLACALYECGEYHEALVCWADVKERSKKLGDREVYAQACLRLGCCRAQLGEKVTGAEETLKGITAWHEWHKPVETVGLAWAIADLWLKEFNDTVSAIRILRGTQELLRTLQSSESSEAGAPGVTDLLVAIEDRIKSMESDPQVFIRQARRAFDAGDRERALRLLKQGLDMCPENGRKQDRATIHNFLGYVYRLMAEAAQAIPHLERAVELFDALNDLEGYTLALSNLAHVYREQGELGRAVEHYRKMIERLERAGDLVTAALARIDAADILLDKLSTGVKELDEAKSIAREAEDMLGPTLPLLEKIEAIHKQRVIRIRDVCYRILSL